MSSTNEPLVTYTPGLTVTPVEPAGMVATPLTLSAFGRPLVRRAKLLFAVKLAPSRLIAWHGDHLAENVDGSVPVGI